jgi:hypothetical protein
MGRVAQSALGPVALEVVSLRLRPRSGGRPAGQPKISRFAIGVFVLFKGQIACSLLANTGISEEGRGSAADAYGRLSRPTRAQQLRNNLT